MPIKLTVSIVSYNNYTDINRLLVSMEKHTSPLLMKKIFVVDNGASVSHDSEQKEFLKFLSKMKDVQYINAGSNVGFGKGHNLVIPYMNSEYHAIVNPDIEFCEDAFTKIIEWMDLNPEIGMVIPLITDSEGNRQEVYRRELTVFDMFNRMFLKGAFRKRYNQHVMKDMDYTKPFHVPFGQGSFLVVRTNLFKDLNGFDDHYFMYVEDADLCKRVNQISELKYLPSARVIHRWERGSHKNKTLFKYHIQSMRYYFSKWGWKFF